MAQGGTERGKGRRWLRCRRGKGGKDAPLRRSSRREEKKRSIPWEEEGERTFPSLSKKDNSIGKEKKKNLEKEISHSAASGGNQESGSVKAQVGRREKRKRYNFRKRKGRGSLSLRAFRKNFFFLRGRKKRGGDSGGRHQREEEFNVCLGRISGGEECMFFS